MYHLIQHTVTEPKLSILASHQNQAHHQKGELFKFKPPQRLAGCICSISHKPMRIQRCHKWKVDLRHRLSNSAMICRDSRLSKPTFEQTFSGDRFGPGYMRLGLNTRSVTRFRDTAHKWQLTKTISAGRNDGHYFRICSETVISVDDLRRKLNQTFIFTACVRSSSWESFDLKTKLRSERAWLKIGNGINRPHQWKALHGTGRYSIFVWTDDGRRSYSGRTHVD